MNKHRVPDLLSLIIWFPTAVNMNEVTVNTDERIRSQDFQSVAMWVCSTPHNLTPLRAGRQWFPQDPVANIDNVIHDTRQERESVFQNEVIRKAVGAYLWYRIPSSFQTYWVRISRNDAWVPEFLTSTLGDSYAH